MTCKKSVTKREGGVTYVIDLIQASKRLDSILEGYWVRKWSTGLAEGESLSPRQIKQNIPSLSSGELACLVAGVLRSNGVECKNPEFGLSYLVECALNSVSRNGGVHVCAQARPNPAVAYPHLSWSGWNDVHRQGNRKVRTKRELEEASKGLIG